MFGNGNDPAQLDARGLSQKLGLVAGIGHGFPAGIVQERLGIGKAKGQAIELVGAVAHRRIKNGAEIVEIAHDLGYNDQANFTRAFRRWTGLTPTEYRQLHAR